MFFIKFFRNLFLFSIFWIFSTSKKFFQIRYGVLVKLSDATRTTRFGAVASFVLAVECRSIRTVSDNPSVGHTLEVLFAVGVVLRSADRISLITDFETRLIQLWAIDRWNHNLTACFGCPPTFPSLRRARHHRYTKNDENHKLRKWSALQTFK